MCRDGGSAKKPVRPVRNKGTQASLKDASSEEEIESSAEEEQEDGAGETGTTPAPSRPAGGTADRCDWCTWFTGRYVGGQKHAPEQHIVQGSHMGMEGNGPLLV